VVDRVVTNPWLKAFMDLECFVLSGMTAKDTLTAEMAFMFMERWAGCAGQAQGPPCLSACARRCNHASGVCVKVALTKHGGTRHAPLVFMDGRRVHILEGGRERTRCPVLKYPHALPAHTPPPAAPALVGTRAGQPLTTQ